MQFSRDREPMRSHSSLQLDQPYVKGPFRFLNPTQAQYRHIHAPKHVAHAEKQREGSDSSDPSRDTSDAIDQEPAQAASNVKYKWTSRNNRKGRHALVINPTDPQSPDAHYDTPSPSNSSHNIMHTILLMFYYYPVWDVSWWVAYLFTIGSIIWVINAFFVFLPLLKPATEFPSESLYGGGITAFIGATIFEIGSILLMLEAVNENRAGCFGWAVETVYGDHFGRHNQSKTNGNNGAEKGAVLRIRPDLHHCSHHHQNRHNLVGKPLAAAHESEQATTPPGARSWTWFPSGHELRTHYIHDLGFLACLTQLFGASVFWISGLTALPGIYDHLSTPALNGAYWFPQVLGGLGFVGSGILFTLETQEKWWKPAPKVLGWHIGVWNLIGGFGFFMCPCFGFNTASWAVFQASCSTFWGSWAFLIGSTIQLYESLVKHPVEIAKEKKAS